MLLAREFVGYIARQLVRRIAPAMVDTPDPQAAAEFVYQVIYDELDAEDQLNDDVRDLLEQHSDLMRREGISYSEMFRRAKNQLIAQRKVVRASGRDTGDAMKLSRDKINEIAHKLVNGMRTARQFRLKKPANDIRLAVVQGMTEILMTEDKADRAARDKVRSQKRDIPEGSEEFDLLQKRYYAEELKKLGVDLAR